MKRKPTLKFLIAMTAMALMPWNHLMAQFSLSAELRPRAEYRHGFKTLAADDAKAAFQVSQRTRLKAGYTVKGLKFGITLQDIRLWGETPQLTATSNRTMLHEGWAELALGAKAALKIGRQELVYDDARILGNVDWAQQARAHDLLLFKYENTFKLHAGAAFNQASDLLFGTTYEMTTNYKTMQFVWLNKKFDAFGASVLFLNNGMEYKYTENSVDKYKTVFSQTFGTHLEYAAKSLKLAGNAYYSTGKDAADRDLSAYNLMLTADLNLTKNVTTGLGYELLSGTSQKTMATDADYINNSFNPFYGTNHKFNGFMDYFFVGNHLNSVGLSDLFASVSAKHKSTNVQLTGHFFSAANDVLAANSTTEVMKKYLGTEIDLTVTYKVNEMTSFTAGYSQMFGTETMQKLKGGNYKNTNNWAWLMLTFKPTFLP